MRQQLADQDGRSPANLSWSQRLSMVMVKSSAIKASVISATVAALVAGAIIFAALAWHQNGLQADDVVLAVAFTAVFGVIIGVAMVAGINKQRQSLDDYLGVQLSGEDRVNLQLWYRGRQKPQSSRLQPVLPRYIEFLDRQVRGEMFISKDMQWLYFGILALQILLHLTTIIWGDPSMWSYFGLLLFSWLAVMYYPNKPHAVERLVLKMNARQVRRLDVMRQQVVS
jgi:hypothetical protein